ncbi:MAG: hypothetical protein ACRCT8_17320 [Lacipirellulaceae bacterium]
MHRSSLAVRAAAVCVGLLCSYGAAAQSAIPWESRPYRVRVVVAAEGPAASACLGRVVEELREKLARRVGLAWRASVAVASVDERPIVDAATLPLHGADLTEAPEVGDEFDKAIYGVVHEGPAGVAVRAREVDAATGRWGPLAARDVGRVEGASEPLLGAVVEALQPVFRFELDPRDEPRVRLDAQGRRLAEAQGPAPGTVLMPYTRRTNRSGVAGGAPLTLTRWTYLVIEPSAEGAKAKPSDLPIARVYSHKRSPFGVRRLGRVEHWAFVVATDASRGTSLRLHDYTNRATALAGYAVLWGEPDDPKPVTLGRTGTDGRFTLPAAESLRFATVRVGETVVARLPIAPGVESEIEVPLLDERPRLAAEAKITLLREELIDLVARRKILATRVRTKLLNNELEVAERLLRELEGLPARSQFNQRIDAAQRIYRATNPVLQRRLDRIFVEIQTTLAKALDTRDITDLNAELRRARDGAQPAATVTPASNPAPADEPASTAEQQDP